MANKKYQLLAQKKNHMIIFTTDLFFLFLQELLWLFVSYLKDHHIFFQILIYLYMMLKQFEILQLVLFLISFGTILVRISFTEEICLIHFRFNIFFYIINIQIRFLNQKKLNMKIMNVFLSAMINALVIKVLSKSTSNSTALGNNLIDNGDFTSPNIPGKEYTKSAKSIKSWQCTNNCQLINIQPICKDFLQFCEVTNDQAINITASTSANKNISQSVDLTAADYLLSIETLSTSYINSPNISIYANQTLIASFYIDREKNSNMFNYSKTVCLSAGKTNLSIVMLQANLNGTIYDIMALQQILSVTNTSNTSQTSQPNATINSTISINTTTNYTTLDNTTNTNTTSMNDSTTSSYSNETNITMNSTIPVSDIIQSSDYQFASATISSIINNSFASTINQIPGSRIVGNLLMRFYKNFDRLELYYFHVENLTIFSQMFLSAIFKMQQAKGTLIEATVDLYSNNSVICRSIKGALRYLTETANYKKDYVNQYILEKNQNGDSFVANNINYFYYQLPMILVIQFLCWNLFKLFIKLPISTIFRKYCFLGLILAMMFEGSIEQFIFYYFRQCKNLFSACFSHKLVNIVMIYFGFLMTFYSFGCMLWFYAYYKKMAKYFAEDYRFKMMSFVGESVQSGIIPFTSGITHSLLFSHLNNVTFALIFMEVCWIAIRIKFICNKIYIYPLRIYLNIAASVLRIFFTLSLYAYHLTQDMRINTFHFYFIIIYMGIWIIEIIYTITLICKDLVIYFRDRLSQRQQIKIKIKGSRKSKTTGGQNILDFSIGVTRKNKVKFKVAYKDISPVNEIVEPSYNMQISNIILTENPKLYVLAKKFRKNRVHNFQQ